MRYRVYLLGCAVLLLCPRACALAARGEAGPGEKAAAEVAAPPAVAPPPKPSPVRLGREAGPYKEAYLDVFGIVVGDNTCSRFFRGAAAAEALNGFVSRLETAYMPGHIGIRMQGEYVVVSDASTGNTYRLFERAVVNLNGPFFSSRNLARSYGGRIGSFKAGTRGARALMLLHELAHLIRGEDGSWLIPNDGGDALLSDRNTALIERRCGVQLRALGYGAP